MKTTTATNKRGRRKAQPARGPGISRAGKIHPILTCPVQTTRAIRGSRSALPTGGAPGPGHGKRYARPITVMDRKTHFAMRANKAFQTFRQRTVARHSDILDAWCVDTCQMWNAGLGKAFEGGQAEDVYWLIPGDFDYGTPVGREVLGRLHDLPEIVLELGQDLCIGEIATDHGNSKQLIDTYGTFALLYNSFPAEAREIRQFTERPRSEFFAVRHSFLRNCSNGGGILMSKRWSCCCTRCRAGRT